MKAVCQKIDLRLFCWEMSPKRFFQVYFLQILHKQFLLWRTCQQCPSFSKNRFQIYFGELLYGMFPTIIPLFIDCYYLRNKTHSSRNLLEDLSTIFGKSFRRYLSGYYWLYFLRTPFQRGVPETFIHQKKHELTDTSCMVWSPLRVGHAEVVVGV